MIKNQRFRFFDDEARDEINLFQKEENSKSFLYT